MSSKFVAYNSSKAALNMQSAVLANRWATSHSKTGIQSACHVSSSPQRFDKKLPSKRLASPLPTFLQCLSHAGSSWSCFEPCVPAVADLRCAWLRAAPFLPAA